MLSIVTDLFDLGGIVVWMSDGLFFQQYAVANRVMTKDIVIISKVVIAMPCAARAISVIKKAAACAMAMNLSVV